MKSKIYCLLFLFLLITSNCLAIKKENILILYTQDFTDNYIASNVINGITDGFSDSEYIIRVLNLCYLINCNDILDIDINKKFQWALNLHCKYIFILFDNTYRFLVQHRLYTKLNSDITSTIIIFGLMRDPEQYVYTVGSLYDIKIFKKNSEYIHYDDQMNKLVFESKYLHNSQLDKYYDSTKLYYFFIYWDALKMINEYVCKLNNNIVIYVLYNNLDYQSVRFLHMLIHQYNISKYNDLYTFKSINIQSVNDLLKYLKDNIRCNVHNIIYNTINKLEYSLYSIDINSSEICRLIYKSRIKCKITSINKQDINRFNMFRTIVIDWYEMGKMLADFIIKNNINKIKKVYSIKYDVWEE